MGMQMRLRESYGDFAWSISGKDNEILRLFEARKRQQPV
jgi:hypothetical protein